MLPVDFFWFWVLTLCTLAWCLKVIVVYAKVAVFYLTLLYNIHTPVKPIDLYRADASQVDNNCLSGLGYC